MLGLLILMSFYLYQSGSLNRALSSFSLLFHRSNQLIQQSSIGAFTTGDNRIQAFFTTPSLIYPDRREQRGTSPLLSALIADVNAAKTSVAVASFDFDIREFTDALIQARRRGVTIRVIVDSENLDTPEVSRQTGRLQAAGIAVHFDHREPFMHNKFVVVDETVAWTGSWNITVNDTWRNNNNMLRFASRAVAADYLHEFEQMFAGRFGTRKISDTPSPRVQVGAAHVEVYFSPQDGVANHVLQRLAAATRSIHFMTFSYTSDPIATTMIKKAQAGVLVQGVFETQNAHGSGSQFDRLKQGGVEVLEDGNCYILHHKVMVLDDRTVITGSYNFTSSAEQDNDENLVIVDDPALARAYLDEFARVYAEALNPMRCS